MKRKWREMKYDRVLDCWMVQLDDRKIMLKAGEWFDLCFGTTSVLCRVGWDRQWYVVMKDLRFHLHRKETYKVEIEL